MCFPRTQIISTSCFFLSASEDLLLLRAPLVSGTNVTIEWVLPAHIIPKQTTVVVWSVSDVHAAANYVVQPHEGTSMSLMLAQGEVYVCMVLVDVQGGGRLQSNPVQFRVPNGEEREVNSVGVHCSYISWPAVQQVVVPLV